MAINLKDKEVEVNGQKISTESVVKLNIKTIIWIVGVLFTCLSSAAGWAYFDLRSQLKEATEISSNEKQEFFEDVEDEYDGKLDAMLREVLEMKGDIKVILDRENRIAPIQPNPGVVIQPIIPPSSVTQPPSN